MAKMIEFLFDTANDKFPMWHDREYASEQKKYNSEVDAFMQKLSDSQREELEQLLSKRNYLSTLEQCHFFTEGFRYGAILMTEVFTGESAKDN